MINFEISLPKDQAVLEYLIEVVLPQTGILTLDIHRTDEEYFATYGKYPGKE